MKEEQKKIGILETHRKRVQEEFQEIEMIQIRPVIIANEVFVVISRSNVQDYIYSFCSLCSLFNRGQEMLFFCLFFLARDVHQPWNHTVYHRGELSQTKGNNCKKKDLVDE